MVARSLASMARQAGWARLAASMARRVSAWPMAGTVPTASPVEGLRTVRVLPLSAWTHWPSMQLAWRNSSGSFSGSLARASSMMVSFPRPGR